MSVLISLYRRLPFRPHCYAIGDVHSWLCQLFLPIGLSTKCYNEHPDR